MSASQPPAFNPDEKKNQHYVPVFWQRRFAGLDSTLWSLQNGMVQVAAARSMMSEDWLYTTFDDQWNPSNILENVAQRKETEAASILRNLDAPGCIGSLEEQLTLRYFFAFSACRHPDTMGIGHRRGKELASLFSQVHSIDVEEFSKHAKRFGLNPVDASLAYAKLKSISKERLIYEAAEVETLSPQHPGLPKQLTIEPETIARLFFLLATLSITIIEAPTDHFFVLGDTPFPLNMGAGFTLPISCHLALRWEPGATTMFPDWTRRVAKSSEVEESNRQQADNALKVVIGPTKSALEQLIARTPQR